MSDQPKAPKTAPKEKTDELDEKQLEQMAGGRGEKTIKLDGGR